GRLILKYDSTVNYVDADISPDFVNPFLHLLVYDLDTMLPFDILKTRISFQMPDESHAGDTMHFTGYFYIDSASVEVLKDSIQYNPVLRCSHDPNDKTVNPSGVRDQNYTLIDDKLTYTIRFENTGNIDAIDITVIDTLDASLDMSTFKVVNSSFPPVTYINDHIVEFHMPNIWLAPKETGMISYEIKPISALPILTSIENKASIIFESNQPVVTNTTHNTMVDALCTDVNTVENVTICRGESYSGHTESGAYLDTTHIGIYCDSVHQINLTVREAEFIEMDTLICEGESFLGFDSAGIYTYESINSMTGCTDVVQLTLGIIPIGESNCTTGSIDLESDDLKIYPNPTSDEIYIEAKRPIESIVMTTFDGKKVSFIHCTTSDKRTKLIPGENIPGGLYIVTIISDGHLYNHKIIILKI
ncbi:MAG: T9SS type A sorting domain-containing protein, partial [Saprospiraceae bacterium]